MPQIEVAFDIDANGIVNVSAKDMGTGREQKITITASSGLSKDEIDKMMRDAESHSAEDATKRDEIEARNKLDGLIYQMEKTLNENREKVGAVAGEVETAIADAKKAVEEGGVERMNNAFNALTDCLAQNGRSALPADGFGSGRLKPTEINRRRRARHQRVKPAATTT